MIMAIVILMLLIGLILSIAKPYVFILYYGLFGTNYGARGFTGLFDSIFEYYSLIMQCLVIVALIRALLDYKRIKHNVKMKKWVNVSILFLATSIISLMIAFAFSDIAGNLFSRTIIACSSFGPAVFIVWLVYRSNKVASKRAFLIFSVIQCLIALLIIYGPRSGLTFFEMFNAGHYNNGYYYLDEYNNMVASFGDLLNTFIGAKNSLFLRCAQFHNSNGLGFAAGVLLFLLLYWGFVGDEKRSIFVKIICSIGVAVSFLLWSNSGMRGVVLGLACAALMYSFHGVFRNQKVKGTQLLLGLSLVSIIVVLTFWGSGSLISYFVGEGATSSLNSRMLLIDRTFEYFFDFFLVGNGGDLDNLVSLGIDPHFLPLRIFCMYGIIPALVSLYMVFFMPIKELLLRKNTFYSYGCILIVVFVALTNNYTETVLFWVLLAEGVIEGIEQRGIEYTKSNKRNRNNILYAINKVGANHD